MRNNRLWQVTGESHTLGLALYELQETVMR